MLYIERKTTVSIHFEISINLNSEIYFGTTKYKEKLSTTPAANNTPNISHYSTSFTASTTEKPTGVSLQEESSTYLQRIIVQPHHT